MPQEHLIVDFSGGVNPSQAVDKLLDNESLQLQNCRLDELGNLASASPSSLQIKGLVDTSSNSNVHSIYADQTIGAICISGADFFAGSMLSGLTSRQVGLDPNKVKGSISSAPTRIYFENGDGVAYAFDPSLSVPITVDWPSPASAQATTTSKTAGTGGTTSVAGRPAWTNVSNLTGTSGFATVQLSTATPTSQYLNATGFGFSLSTSTLQGIQVSLNARLSGLETTGYVQIVAVLLRAGIPVGVTNTASLYQSSTIQLTFGNSQYLWSSGLGSSDVNSASFGVRFYATLSANAAVTPVTLSVQDCVITASQAGAGFVVGTAGSGTNLAGTYTYVVSFQAASGEESGASAPSIPVSLGGAAGTLTSIPTGDARTAARLIYRQGGSANSFYLVGQISDNVSTTYYDNQSDLAAITEGVILPGNVAGTSASTRLGSQAVKYPCAHLERIFWANANSNTLIWSDVVTGAFSYPAVNFFEVGDSKPITGLVSKWGCLIIIKTDSIWILSGTDESNFSLAKTESSVGSNQPFTIAPIANGILFGNSSGIFLFNGATSVKFTSKLDLLYRGQARTAAPAIETRNASVYMNHCAVATANEYWFACAALGGTSNSLLFIINLNNGAITTRSADVLSLAVDQVTQFLYAGLANGEVVLMDDYLATSDSQGPFMWTYQSKFTDCNARGSNLDFWSFEFYGNTNGQLVTPTIYYDQGTTGEVLAPFSTTGLQRVQRSFAAATSRKGQTVSIRLDANLTTGPIDLTHLKIFYDVLPGRSRTGQ